jgi:hypothetical protein
VLHYKLDVDLPPKVELALRERQHEHGSREYEGYARLLSKGHCDLLLDGSRRFEGVQSLIDAGLAGPGEIASRGSAAPSLDWIVDQVWQHGDPAVQKEVWNRAWAAF